MTGFVEACQMLDYVEYLADLLIAAELEQRVKNRRNAEQGWPDWFGGTADRLKKEDNAHEKQTQLDGMPVWFDGKASTKPCFVRSLQTHKIIFTNGAFYARRPCDR